jgi:hypothetical protein
MGLITISISDETEERFRAVVRRIFGDRKGALGKAATEAMDLWVERPTQETLAADARALLDYEHGCGGPVPTDREVLYDRCARAR